MEKPDLVPSLRDPRVGEASPARPDTGAAPAQQASPAFRALLEQLETRTRELRSGSEAVDGPEPLRNAVAEAGSSLDAALSLGDRLLEAYRESVQRGDEPEAPR